MNDETTTQERLDLWCDEVVRDVRRAGRSGDGLEGYLEAVPLGREKVRKDCWDFTITTGGPGVWLRITPTRATVIGAWGTARYEQRVALKPTLLRRAVDITNELETFD